MMEKYAKKEIDEDFYLQRMGAISLKLARVAHKPMLLRLALRLRQCLALWRLLKKILIAIIPYRKRGPCLSQRTPTAPVILSRMLEQKLSQVWLTS